MNVLEVGQVWNDEEGTQDEIIAIDVGTSYPVQFKMLPSGIIGRDSVEGFLDSHTQPTSWWLALLDETAKLC